MKNEENTPPVTWTRVIALWCFAAAFFGLYVTANAKGMSGADAVCILAAGTFAAIAMMGTVFLVAIWWARPDEPPFQTGSTPWSRNDHEEF